MRSAKELCIPKGLCTNEEIEGPRKVIYKKQHCVEKFRTFGKTESEPNFKRKRIPPVCKDFLANLKETDMKKPVRKTVIHKSDLERIKNVANQNAVLLKKAAEEEEEKKRKMMDMSIQMIQHFRDIDQAKFLAQQTESDDLKKEKAKDKFKTLDRAFIAKHEREEEVKLLTRMIGNTKCKAYIDAQVMAKKIDDEKRLAERQKFENVLLKNDKKKVEELDDKRVKEKLARLKYASDVKRQIEEKELIRFNEMEREALETKGMKKAQEAYLLQVEKDKAKALERRRRLRREYDEIIEFRQLFKKISIQQEMVEEKTRAEYTKAKIENERKLKEEQKMMMKAFMKKQEDLYNLGLKQNDAENHRYEMSLILQAEHLERDYRRKELESAKRKKKILEELNRMRQEEKRKKLQKKAIAIALAEEEFNILLKKIKAEEEKALQKERERKAGKDCYRQDLIEQINRKEMVRREAERVKRKEAFEIKDNEQQRNEGIKAVIRTKIEALRQACLPEKYVHEIEMQFEKVIAKRKLN